MFVGARYIGNRIAMAEEEDEGAPKCCLEKLRRKGKSACGRERGCRKGG